MSVDPALIALHGQVRADGNWVLAEDLDDVLKHSQQSNILGRH